MHTDPGSIDAADWDDLLVASDAVTPFMRHAYLLALHASGSATPETGWSASFLVVMRDGRMEAACPLYIKTHSYGEYVFDWAWAQAYENAGLAYYPKLLCAVPFTPVPGARLLARTDEARSVLLRAMQAFATQQGWSSAHVLFLSEADQRCAQAAGWMLRSTVQFHWTQNAAAPHASFAEFTASLQREKRKKIAQERRYVTEAGVSFETLRGAQIDAAAWDFFYRCYTATYRAHHSTPYLSRDFFNCMAQTMPEHWLLFVATKDGQRIAASLVAIDNACGHAWGRYWGQVPGSPPVKCLHFEACYYQPLAWCIAQGFVRFEGGAQGEHKMARGLLPVRTASAHWLSDARFADAVARFLEREGQGVEAYVGELSERNPFKASP